VDLVEQAGDALDFVENYPLAFGHCPQHAGEE
jgi:hypothetical protein